MSYEAPSLRRGRVATGNQIPTIASAAAATNQVKVTATYGGAGPVRGVEIELTGLVVSLTDDGSTGHGSIQLLDMPEGYIAWCGAAGKGTLTATAGGNIQVSLGTTATADATLSSTDANILVASSASSTVFNSASGPSATAISGDATAADVYLNLGTSGDPSSGATVTLTGKFWIYFIHIGDA